jgi:hypothetical protein
MVVIFANKEMHVSRALPVLALSFILKGHTSIDTDISDANLRQPLERGISYQYLSRDVIELMDEETGLAWQRSLEEPSYQGILAWADTEGVPILEIDPLTLDTSKYQGWYYQWTEVPLSNANIPVIIGDVNGNGLAEFYGSFKDSISDFETHVYEVDTSGIPNLMFVYDPRPGVARSLVDADNDSLLEITFSLSGVMSDFEQPSNSSLPTVFRFSHDQYRSTVQAVFTGIFIGKLDSDDEADFLYSGSEEDSVGARVKAYIAEYDIDSVNFVRVWSADFQSGSDLCGYSVADFDRDDKNEFALSVSTGEVIMVENTNDNEYIEEWNYDLPFTSLCYHGFGNVDGDSYEEFFVCATTLSGNWVTVFEADSVNSYSPKILIKLPWGGFLDVPTLVTDDMDGDGVDELLVTSANNLFVFNSNVDDVYELWYFQPISFSLGSVQTYQWFGDNRRSIVISGDTVDTHFRKRNLCRVYRPSPILNVSDESDQALSRSSSLVSLYPNPFNSQLTITYDIKEKQNVKIMVFSIDGRKLLTLVDRVHEVGLHSIEWNARGFATGTYLIQLVAKDVNLIRKTILVR